MSDIYSYHTYILPFVWKDDCNNSKSFDEFIRVFEKNPYWTCYDPKDENSFNDLEDEFSYYNEYQYFYPQIRSALYGFDENIVKTYHFAYDMVHNKAHYYIEKHGRKYDLLINSIYLKIYNTGIALFVMECENHGVDKDGKPQNTLADVKSINDYGRRINLPFIPTEPQWSICADSLEVFVPGFAKFRTDFSLYIKEISCSAEKKDSINLNHLSSFIKGILGFQSDYQFSSKINKDKKSVYVHPGLDDRMFVACLVNDREATGKFIGKETDGDEEVYKHDYDYKKNTDLSKSLYELIFVDPAKGCSCQSAKMRADLLEKHIYKRWIENGSIYGVAAQSIVLLFDGGFAPLIGSFLTIYVRMACLCLAQRASLMYFQKETADISRLIHEKKNKISVATVTRLMNLQERFSAFESQICFKEITPQEQGIEMYSMFMDSFFIEKELENVKSQIDGLHDATDTYLDFSFNKFALMFTVIGGILGVLELINLPSDEWSQWLRYIGIGISACCVVMLLIIYRRRKK